LIKKLLKEPLVHFLFAGVALFLVFEFVVKESPYDASKRIVVNGEALLDFLQYSSRSDPPDRLDDFSSEELGRLIDNFVREEVLFREAKALGLDTKDYRVRRQLIRRLESANQMYVSSGIQLSETDLEDFLAANQDRYHVPATITFTHVYFSVDKHGAKGALALARAKLEELNRGQVPFHRAPSHGDRFLYHHNYVKTPADEVTSHFGSAMQRELFTRDAKDALWIGPLRSSYGYHLVMLTDSTAGYDPPLDEVRRRVEADAYQARLEAELEKITSSLVSSYEIVIDAPLQSRLNRVAGSEPQITN
jgi:hypothetical protein